MTEAHPNRQQRHGGDPHRVDITPEDLDKILSVDAERWRREMGHREQHLAQFDGLPDEIWAALRRMAAALGLGAD